MWQHAVVTVRTVVTVTCACSESGASEETVMSSPSLVWVTEAGTLAIADVPSVGGYRGRRAALQPKHTLPLALSESVLDVSPESSMYYDCPCHPLSSSLATFST